MARKKARRYALPALRELRLEAAKSREELAQRIGKDEVYIGRLEDGQRLASVRLISRLAFALDTGFAELMHRGRDQKESHYTPLSGISWHVDERSRIQEAAS